MPLDEVADDGSELRFRHRGSCGGLAPAAFVGLLAPATYFLVGPVIGWLNAALAAILAAGFAVSGLAAWDLRLDLRRREYELRRGMRRFQRRISGSFSDFEKVSVDAGWYDGLCVFVVPRGSARGYLLYRGLDRDAARGKGAALAAQLAVPLEEVPPHDPWRPIDAELRFPPPKVPVAVSSAGDGVRAELSRRDWIVVSPEGIAAGGQRVAWPDVTQIIVSNVLTGRNENSSWRIRRDWRSDMRERWRQRCAELKQPHSPLPWWGVAWYFYEGRPREYEKTVCIFRRNGVYLTAGSNWKLGDDGLRWLYGGIVSYGRSRGARFTTRS